MNASDREGVQIPNYPRAGESIIALILALGVNLFLALVLVIFIMTTSPSIPGLGEILEDLSKLNELIYLIVEAAYSPTFIAISGVFSFGIWPFFFLRARREHIKSILRLNFTLGSLLIGILSGVAMVSVALGLEWAISQFISPDPNTARLLNEVMVVNYRGPRFVLGVLAMGVITGFCEEIFFRGFMMRGFENSLKSPWLAILITSLIFTIVHLNIMGFIPIFVLAMAMGILVVKTNSIYPAIACHATYNSIILTITVFGGV